mgnify:CR=1 FL=1
MNTWNTKEISIDFIEKVTKCNIEKKKKTYLVLSIVFFTIAILTWIYIFFSMFSMMFVFYMGSNSFVSFVLFAFGIVYLQSYRKTSIILRIINDIKKVIKEILMNYVFYMGFLIIMSCLWLCLLFQIIC